MIIRVSVRQVIFHTIKGVNSGFHHIVGGINNTTIHQGKAFECFCVAADIPAMADQSLDIADEVQYATEILSALPLSYLSICMFVSCSCLMHVV